MNHAHLVLAAPTHCTSLSNEPFFVNTNSFTMHKAETDEQKAAMILPTNCDFMTFYITSEKYVYAQMANDTSMTYTLQTQWNTLSTVVPPDSIVRGIVYVNIHDDLQIGIFDILRNAGLNQSNKDILSRHALLHSLYYQTPKDFTFPIKMHWIGFESVALHHLQNHTHDLPFTPTGLLRISNDHCIKILNI